MDVPSPHGLLAPYASPVRKHTRNKFQNEPRPSSSDVHASYLWGRGRGWESALAGGCPAGGPGGVGEGRTAPPITAPGWPALAASSLTGKGHWCPNSCSASIKMLPECPTFDPSDSGTYGLNGAQRCHWLGFIIPMFVSLSEWGEKRKTKREEYVKIPIRLFFPPHLK